MPEIMNVYEAILAAAEGASAKLIADHKASSRINAGIVTDSLEDAVIGSALIAKRSLVLGSIVSVKRLALMKIPSVLVSLNKTPVNYALNIYPESIQELYDDILCSFKLSEDKKILVPIVIHLDNLLKNTREQLETLSSKVVENFLETYSVEKPEKLLKAILPDNLESVALMQKSLDNVQKYIEAVSDNWKKRTKRSFIPSEKYMTEGADFIILSYGSISTNAKLAVKKLRGLGEKVGLIRMHLFPLTSCEEIVNGRKIAVIDTKFFLGSSGMLHREIKEMNKNTISFIADLASTDDVIELFQHLKTSDKLERVWMV
ncbi:MAG: hypothetical protein HY831_00130 [Candidatus Aenigmarchaeota archaeon]|nr:hypothetical protein [Candidatus Aenigmarchaeota archaeon]